ncbi:hypothetical protein [Novosphingobium sp. B 225]|uniref:hypothetical protein n=1 Tax=Novosphingobium sp. B 225 TaxID=1961849 RepID=UPI001124F222|nr:hypothetical protein [Novosphingobium sp. B 225]
MTDQTTPPAAAPGPLAGLALTVIVLLIIIAWVALGLQFLTDTSLFGGFLLLWFWANNEQLEIKRLPTAIVGALVGIGLAWFVVFAATKWGGAGLAAGLGLMVLALYLDVIKAVPFAINASTMLFLTVAAAPLIQLKVNWQELVLSTVVGGLFFGLVVEALKRLAARFAPAG